MNTTILQSTLLAWVVFFGTNLSAQTDEWKIALSKNGKITTATFTLTADPTLTEKTDMVRLTYAKEIYSFKEAEGNQLEITIKTTVSPGFKVPSMMLKKAFPKKSFENMEKFLEAAKKEVP